jgi:hypothetical protein
VIKKTGFLDCADKAFFLLPNCSGRKKSINLNMDLPFVFNNVMDGIWQQKTN